MSSVSIDVFVPLLHEDSLILFWFRIIRILFSVSSDIRLFQTQMVFFCPLLFIGPEGAFKKLKSESTSLGGVGPGGGSNSCVGNSHLHNPTAAACPTPARRRHRTTFTQVKQPNSFRFHFYEPVFCVTIHRILYLIENFIKELGLFNQEMESDWAQILLICRFKT